MNDKSLRDKILFVFFPLRDCFGRVDLSYDSFYVPGRVESLVGIGVDTIQDVLCSRLDINLIYNETVKIPSYQNLVT